MLIDWFTVGAQLLNFVILVWLMKRFLYQPVLSAIAVREKKIAAALTDAATAKDQALQQQEEFQKKNQEFDDQRAALLQEAKDAAKAEQNRLQLESRAAVDIARAKRAKVLLAEMQQLHAEIALYAQQQVFDIARRVLGELAGVSLEQRICEVFIQRLKSIDGPTLATLSSALKSASDAKPVMVRSAFALPEQQTDVIQAALDAYIGQPIPLQFETKPALVSGIELSANGQKLIWSISEYLDDLLAGLQDQLAVAERA